MAGPSVATVNITIQGVNDGPLAVNDSVSVVQGNNGSFSAVVYWPMTAIPDTHDTLSNHNGGCQQQSRIALSFANGIVAMPRKMPLPV